MRAKLLALREGRILSDDEFISVLSDNSVSVTPAPEEPGLPAEEDAVDEDAEDDDEQVEGENIDEEKSLNDQVDHLMVNLMEQSKDHLSISFLEKI